ncbi:hypothetical protein BSKO_09526 [Bryopsis sp. KO-2023]|nr:hypothetical protein BSKO_09526 [Bryopsis sp. KO-2023]
MSDMMKVLPNALCSHLKNEHIQLLLAAQGLSAKGSRVELEDRLECELKRGTVGTWVWQTLPDLPEARFGCSLVEWEKGLYLYGGFGENGLPSDKLLMWRSGLSSWQNVECDGEGAPPPLYHHSAVVYDREMWIFGSVGTGRLGERRPCIAAYSFDNSAWRHVHASGPVPMCIQQCTTFDACVCDGSVAVASQDGLYAFDIEAEEWKVLYRSPGVTAFWTNYQATLEGRDLYLFGWSDAHVLYEYGEECPAPTLRMYRFNLDTYVWTKISYAGNPPESRDRFSAVRVGDKWIVHGGTNSIIHGKSSDDTYVYNFSTRIWAKFEHGRYQPKMRAHYGCARMGEDRVVFVGGRLDWHGRNRSLSTPCHVVESLQIVKDKTSVDGGSNYQSLLVMSDTNRSIVVNPIRRRLFMNSHLSDVTVVVEGKDIPAHTIVLAEGSTVFDRMWGSDMKENQTRRVEVAEVTYPVMNIVLQYLYGCLDEVPAEFTMDVFRAADLYEVPGLRSECLKLMMNDMDVSTLVDFWHLAHRFSIDELTHACVELASDNPFDLVQSPSFQSYKECEPQLATQLLALIFSRLRNEFSDPEGCLDGSRIPFTQLCCTNGMSLCDAGCLGNETRENSDAKDVHGKLESRILGLVQKSCV